MYFISGTEKEVSTLSTPSHRRTYTVTPTAHRGSKVLTMVGLTSRPEGLVKLTIPWS